MNSLRILDRFVASASYAAYMRLLAMLPDGINNFLITGLLPLWIVGVMCTGSLRGVQNVLALLAGQGLASMVPMPAEPVGYLLLPATTVYLGVIASMGWLVDRCLRLTTLHASVVGDAFASVFEQYLALFAIARVIATFVDAGQATSLYVLSFVYVALPEAFAPCVATLPPVLPQGGNTWPRHFVRNLEGLAVRGLVRWLLEQLPYVATVGAGLLVFQLLLVFMTGLDETKTKWGGFHTILSLVTAQQLVSLLRTSARLSEWICVWSLVGCATVLLIVSGHRGRRHSFGDICAFGTSLLLITELEHWLNGSDATEAATVYLVVFCVLEVLHQEASWSTAARGGSVIPAQGTLGLALATEEGLVIW
jgi:hypothetical protein